MNIEEIISKINKEFNGLTFDYAEFNEEYHDIEVHFKGGKYFCLGHTLTPTVQLRQIRINPKFASEKKEET